MRKSISSFFHCMFSGKDLKNRIKRLDAITIEFRENELAMDEALLALEERDNLIQGIINNAPSMVWHKDRDGKYILINEEIRKQLFYNIPKKLIIGSTDVELAQIFRAMVGVENHTFGELCEDSDKATYFADEATQFYETGKINGEYKRIIVHKNVLRDIKGAVIGTVGVGRDVTADYAYLDDVASLDDPLKMRDLIHAYIERHRFRLDKSVLIGCEK